MVAPEGWVPAPIEDEVQRAAECLALGDADAALALLKPLMVQSPTMPVQFVLGLAAWDLGQLDTSVELMRQCHEADPMDGTVAEVLASLYAQVGNLKESLFIGKLATALGGYGHLARLIPPGFPTFDGAFLSIRSEPLLMQARINLAGGKLQAALDMARQHVSLNSTDAEARGFYASILLRSGAASAAVDVLEPIDERHHTAAIASISARARIGVGEIAEGRRLHERAVALASDDAMIAGALVCDSQWWAADAGAAAALAWAQRFCPPAKPARPLSGGSKLVIGYIVPAFVDPLDADAVAAVAHAHDRSTVTVVAYGFGARSWEENLRLSAGFDKWRDISTLDPATTARFFARDGVHVMVDAAGFASPKTLLALARLQNVVRVSWLGNAAGLGQPVYDAMIGPRGAATPPDVAAWTIAGGFPIAGATQSLVGVKSSDVVFGADVTMTQIDPDTTAAWSAVLRAVPQAKLVLRANDMTPGRNIERLIERFGGQLAGRIDLLPALRPMDFYRGIDVALLPLKGASARAAGDALACGIPPVAIVADRGGTPYGALLRDAGLGDVLIAYSVGEYAAMAAALATAPEARSQVVAMIDALRTGEVANVGCYANAIETLTAAALAERTAA